MGKLDIDTFPADKVIEMICTEYAISVTEFNSRYKYNPLPEARKLYCLTLSSAGATHNEIRTITGYESGRVTHTIQSARKLYFEIPFFRKRHDMLHDKLDSL